MADTTTTRTPGPPVEAAAVVSARTLARGFSALRVFTGLVWLSNALGRVCRIMLLG